MIKLLDLYQQAIASQAIHDDPAQRQVLAALQGINDALCLRRNAWLRRIRGKRIKGLYLHGPVGTGKTFLMDLFYEHADCREKSRFHFHQFMQQIDAALRRRQGEKNPLQKIAADLAKTTRLLCLDEFLVHDVAHAMILAEFMQALMKQGVVLVMTSNTEPDDLYLNGVQRQRFLPAIALIKSACTVFAMQQKKDYRLGREAMLTAYITPLDAAAMKTMTEQFASLCPEASGPGSLKVQNRDIAYIQCGKSALWLDFHVICAMPRSQLDYLEIASRFDTIFISGVPALTEKDTAAAILFIQLIDVMYDCGIRLILSAAVPTEALYLKGEMKNTFKRTQSRLMEMQSKDYLARHNRRYMEQFQEDRK